MGWLTDSMASGDIAAYGGVLDILAKAALILLAAFAGARLMRRASAATRYQLWTAALLGVLALPMLSALLPAWQVPLLPAEMLQASSTEAPPAAPAPGPRRATRRAGHDGDDAPGAVVAGAGSAFLSPRAGAASELTAAAPTMSARTRQAIAGLSWSAILAAVWMVGTAALLARLAISTCAAWWVSRRAEPLRGSRWSVTARAVQDRLGISGDVALVTSDKTSMPMAWGIFRPRVLLPREAENWPNERRRVVLMHEMAHVKRRDCQTLLLARLVAALYWVNPLVWVANRQMNAERERACDDLVLSTGTRGTDYAQHLLEIARSMRRPTAAGYAAVAMARPSQLEGRLMRILDPSLNRRRATRFASIAGVAMAVLLVLPLAALQPWAEASIPEPQPQGRQSLEQEPRNDGNDQVDAGNAQDRIVVHENAVDVEEIIQWINGYLTVERVQQWTASATQNLDIDRMVETVIEAARQSGIRGELRSAFDGSEIDEEALAEAMQEAIEAIDEEQIRIAIEVALARLENYEFAYEFAMEARAEQREADPRVIAALTTALGDTEWRIREQAAESLGNLEDPAAIPALSGVLAGDPEARVRAAAAHGLGMIEDAAAVSALSAAVGDEDGRVREEAVWALGMIESDDAVVPLSGALADVSWRVRKEAAWALGMIESPDGVEPLMTIALQDDHARVREQAAWALGMIEDERALDALLDAMTDENLQVRKQVLWAVSMIAGDAD